MTRALKMLQEDPSEEFYAAFCRAAGEFDAEAKSAPARTYTAAEIQELFDYLFELHRNNKKSP